jgi:hypothetical protein
MSGMPPLHALFALALVLAPSVRAQEPVYVLDAAETEEAVYFYNAADGALVFEKTAADRKKDPAAGFGHPTLVERTNVVVYVDKRTGEVRSAVGRWTDRKGHARTLDVLKDQVAFAGEARHQPLQLSTPAFSGVLDRPTLLLPHLRALIRFEALARRFQARCELTAKACVGPLNDPFLSRASAELLAAAAEVKALALVLESVSLQKPAPPAALTPYPFAGLDVPPPGSSAVTVDYALSGYLKALTPQTLRIVPGGPGPGDTLTESRDPRYLDAGTLQRMAEAEKAAALKLDSVEKVLDDFFGKTR